MADTEEMFLRAKHRTFSGLSEEAERQWTGPFCFVQAADPQLGLMKSWRIGDAVGGGDEWEEEVALTKQAVAGVNQLQPRPRFMVLCGDLVHAMPGTEFREAQERDLKEALRGTDPSIPLVFVSGNHDLDQVPTPSTVERYCQSWGDDYFSFWVGGVLCLVLNSQLYFNASACPQQKAAQETWLEAQLSRASSAEPKPKHILVFQHIPLYVKSPDEQDEYFNLPQEARQSLIERFKRAGVTAVFSGHYHRNAGGCHDGLDMVVTSAIGCQLGDDTHGVRLVAVTADAVVHRYVTMEQLGQRSVDEELRKMLQAC
ncbi:serine/threonine-protein phosphatase CPPED1 [Poeciliopsis prolifica]|uniref:serine/threonine-protein phosphatase CPPED1 n=1 Tax=Poeciliopsis prolifica TaxID=188132 RepID=UPI002414318F|nr:serine/threonine-protein phosphatase CPPED1 [Poeciliopsis prolifica]